MRLCWELKHLLDESIYQGLVYVQGRKVKINEVDAYHQSTACLLGKLRHLLGESIHQCLVNGEGRKVDKNELTINLARVCCGSSGISWASLSTSVWLMRRGGRLI